jgi:glycosyltransferase involved in cell wall biosynthesis
VKVLIITPNALHNGPRLIREIDALKSEYKIVAVGATPPHDDEVSYIPFSTVDIGLPDKVLRKLYRMILKKPFLRNLPVKERRIHRLIKRERPDIVIVHSPIELPYLFSYPNRMFKIVYNAHEYHPLEFDYNTRWMETTGLMYQRLYRTYLDKCDLIINVCDGIAEKCFTEFGVKSMVFPNVATYHDAPIKNLSDFSKRPLRFIHHGVTNPDRKIENMIEAFRKLGNNYELDLMLMKNQDEYFEKLKQEVDRTINVRIIQTVPFKEIVPFISQYHAGLYVLPPNSFNNKYSLPNKFFEFIQARLPIVCGPSVEMKKIVERYAIGTVSNDFTAESLIETIQKLTKEELELYQRNTHKAARELSAESFQEIFKKEVKALI